VPEGKSAAGACPVARIDDSFTRGRRGVHAMLRRWGLSRANER
jgi:hypothetical protein